jgi:hypothetical protein
MLCGAYEFMPRTYTEDQQDPSAGGRDHIMPGPHAFPHTIRTEAELREVMGTPGGLAVGKQLDRLDRYCRAFVALSPFVLFGTYGAGGTCRNGRSARSYRPRVACSATRTPHLV